ncbi:MAG: DUF4097 family beta strand repeat protein [Gemmatimonadetes bacterium]|nr:DUF4097 family beta strand repeat protein [Gemmatimonadota bacterium]
MLAVSALVGGFASGLAAQERHEISGTRVGIYNLAGQVTLEPGRGSAVVVEMTRGGRDARELIVERGPIRDRETLRVIYPADEIRYPTLGWRSDTELPVRDDGTFGDSDVGREGRWSGRRVRIWDRGDFEAFADLRISVRCELASNPTSLDVDTGSGSVTLTLPASYGATVEIETGSGGIDVDFPVEARRFGSDPLTGRIGDGRGTLRVDTGSGSVRILKRAS